MITAIAERIRAQVPADVIAHVAVALTASAWAGLTVTRSPAVFVVPASELPQPNSRATGRVRQAVSTEIVLLIVIRSAGDPAGARKVDPWTAVREALIEALLGWAPGAGLGPMTYGGMVTDSYADQVASWEMRWFVTSDVVST